MIPMLKGTILDINPTLFIQIANFLVLLIILNFIAYRPIRKILRRRSEEINAFEGTIGDFRDKSSRYGRQLEANMIGARKEGFDEKEGLKKAGLEEEKGMVNEASSQAGEKIDQAKKEIEGYVAQARQSLEKEVAAFSKELAEKILGRTV